MKKLLKIALYILGGLIALGLIAVLVLSESKPEATPSQKGDMLAQNMLASLDKPGWDTLKYLQWEFASLNRYLFDKQGNKAQIISGNTRVVMNLDDQTGEAYQGNDKLSGDSKNSALQSAWSNWCNDSFWMFAPYKVMDPNTQRSVVEVEEGTHGLMVEYKGGGVTPGDSYLWILDDNYQPISYKMWVKIIPIGGLEASWEEWVTLPSGAKLSTAHKMGPVTLRLTDVKEGLSLEDLGYEPNLFDI